MSIGAVHSGGLMPVRRRGDGEVVNERTEVVRDQQAGRGFPPESDPEADLPTEPIEQRRSRESLFEREGEPEEGKRGTGERTRVYRPGGRQREADKNTEMAGGDRVALHSGAAMDNPPTGWLVVVRGPGQGQVLTLGNGMNPIGRSAASRVRLDFGDDSVSRENHARLIYEPRQRRWLLNHGDGTNLTYLNGDLVVGTVDLETGGEIQIGETILRFQAFCSTDFDWSDVGD